MNKKYDVAIIGAGPGGYVAAIKAAQLGQKVVLIDKSELGGVCLNWGCIPTKSLLKSSELYRQTLNASKYGIKISGEINFDINDIIKKSRDVSGKLVKGIEYLIKSNKVDFIRGVAHFLDSSNINVTLNDDKQTKQVINAKKIIIATGASPRILKGFEFNGTNIWSSKDALNPSKMPNSMVIVGSGAIGIEFASFYSSFGTKVTVIEARDGILPLEDKEIANIARKSFEKQGIKFYTSAKLLDCKKNKNGNDLEISLNDSKGHEQKISSEVLLIAAGVVPNVNNIGLENTKVKLKDGYIETDNSSMLTSDSNIYAIGDVTAPPWLAHKASHEAINAVNHISGNKTHAIDVMSIPNCTYSFPEISSIGMNEQKAQELGYDVRIGRFPFNANGKALIMGNDTGLIKTIFDKKTGELLGAHMIGNGVTELIHSYAVHKNLEGTEIDLMNTIFPHPTLSEMIHESVLDAYDMPIHIKK